MGQALLGMPIITVIEGQRDVAAPCTDLAHRDARASPRAKCVARSNGRFPRFAGVPSDVNVTSSSSVYVFVRGDGDVADRLQGFQFIFDRRPDLQPGRRRAHKCDRELARGSGRRRALPRLADAHRRII